MEHLIHLLGGGCGEHMLLPILAASFSGLTICIKKVKRKEGHGKRPRRMAGKTCH